MKGVRDALLRRDRLVVDRLRVERRRRETASSAARGFTWPRTPRRELRLSLAHRPTAPTWPRKASTIPDSRRRRRGADVKRTIRRQPAGVAKHARRHRSSRSSARCGFQTAHASTSPRQSGARLRRVNVRTSRRRARPHLLERADDEVDDVRAPRDGQRSRPKVGERPDARRFRTTIASPSGAGGSAQDTTTGAHGRLREHRRGFADDAEVESADGDGVDHLHAARLLRPLDLTQRAASPSSSARVTLSSDSAPNG